MHNITLGDPPLARNRSGYWEIRYSEKVRRGQWRSRTISTGETGKREANTFLKTWLKSEQEAQRRAGEFTVSELIGFYQKHLSETRGGSDAQNWSLKPVEKHFGSMLPEDIQDNDISRYRRTRSKTVVGSTIRRELGALLAALNFNVKKRRLDAQSVPDVDLPPPGAPRDLWLNETQAQEFLALAYGTSIGQERLSRVTRFVAIALGVGARKSAIEGLTWDRVDMELGVFDFRDPGVRVSNKRRVATPFPDHLRPLLERAYRERIDDFVVDARNTRKTFETFLATTPYPWATAHVLRHTWGTLAARRGVPIWEIAGVLGDDEQTVRKNYLHHCPDHLRGAVNHIF